jgi:hypothetical protein
MSNLPKDPTYVGAFGTLALFSLDDRAVAIDVEHNLVVESGLFEALSSSRDWDTETEVYVPTIVEELAAASLVDLNISITAAASSGDRLYTIPKGAQSEAKKALEWRKEEKRGGTPVGLNTARTLAAGGQIGIKKVRHIAKYFPRHEVDKRGKGWSPGEDNFPSNGRIAWALWGGDVAWRWAQAIVEREDKKKSTTASASPGPDLESFSKAMQLDSAVTPEFIARVRMDGSGIDRLYKVDIDSSTYVWDDGSWDDLGSEDGDVFSYDFALDSAEDFVEKSHIPIDPDSAVIIAAKQHQDPSKVVSISEIDEEEAALVMLAAGELDWTLIDYTLTAAGINATDKIYSPEERSQNASSQMRNALGRFAKQGQSVTVDGDPSKSGIITSTDVATGTVGIQTESGETVNVAAKQTRPKTEGGDTNPTSPSDPTPLMDIKDTPLDVSGILAKPRVPVNQPYARMKGSLPSMTPNDLHDVLYNWASWVQEQRSAYNESAVTSSGEKESAGKFEEVEAYDHPLLKRWRVQKKRKKEEIAVEEWASPIVAAPVQSGVDRPKELTPKTSDVQPLYFAIVADDDPRAVLDLVSIVPASSVSNAPMTYKRDKGKWVRTEQILNDMRSATPPPVIPLDSETLNDVLLQVDDATVTASASYSADQILMVLWGPQKDIIDTYGDTFLEVVDKNQSFEDNLKAVFTVVAAGGLDRNRGNAEKLRRYWTAGPGAAKIRWGMGGDWRRCVKNLTKYMGPRSKGYCALRHKEMTGVWTGDKRNRQMYGRKGNGRSLFSTELINSETQTIENAIISARADAARERFGIVASYAVESGAKFYIPLLIPEGLESGDGRKFKKNSITMRDLPLPLLWQIKTATGHDGSVVVGKIETLERVDGGLGNAYGVFDSGPYGREAERLVRNGFIRGISADMDQFEASEDKIEAAENDDDSIKKSKITINKARVMAATIVPKPAFQECSISILDENYYQNQEDNMIPDGIYALDELSSEEAEALVACGIVAGVIPVVPPREWFDNPKLQQATPLTVDDSGRVFGHIASWDTNHIGMSYGTKPPRSKTGYAYFHTGVLRTDNGSDIPVGQLTLAGGHASLEANAMEAVKHYDDTASAVADVHAGEDQYGIWVAGSLRPDATPMQIRSLRASAPSGDWRPIRGSLELVAVCQVNVPGFPVARARVASGAIMALVAAGALPLAQMKQDDPLHYLGLDSSGQSEDLTSRVASLKERMSEFGYISRDTREKLAEKGEALPDGSYPIRNVDDLKNAIQAYGRSNKEDRAKVKKHIIKRARALNVRHLIPENWGSTLSSEDMESVVASLRDRIASFNSEPTKTNSNDLRNRVLAIQEALGKTFAAEEFPVDEVLLEGAEDGGDPGTVDFKFTPGKNQPRDIRGRFRQVLARLKENLGDSGLQDVNEKIKEVDQITGLGDYADAAKAGNELIRLLDRLDSGSLNKESLENVRKTAAELGTVISNLPLPFKDQAQKVRFSDLPPALQQLMKSMVERVEKKIGKDDAAEATAGVTGFMSGSDVYSQSDISSEMAKMLRLLT